MATAKTEESFSQVIRMNVALLKFSGTIPMDDEISSKTLLSCSLTIISGAALILHTSAYIYDFLIHAAFLETAIESLALIIALFGGLVRYLIAYWLRGDMHKILRTLDDLWKTASDDERRCVNSLMKGAKNLTYFFLSQCIFTIFFYTIAPLFVHLHDSNSNATRSLPYAFFTEVNQSPCYEILYFIQVFSMLNVGVTCVGVDMAGPLLITTVCGHLRVIRNRFRSMAQSMKIQMNDKSDIIIPRTCDRYNQAIVDSRLEIGINNPVETSVASELRSCLNYHKIILKICMHIERLTKIIFLTQLIGSTYILSAVGFKLTGNDQDKFKYSSQIVIGVVQLLICNWPPHDLMTESEAIADAAYFVPWYQWPSDLQKSIQIVILRAQKPVRLTAGKFMYLSLETFASMVSSAVSFFTVLRSLN
ncbi:odorant receptor 49b-like [Neodiprion lecontei]|uniref:Odorant receptor n=1 Tax=Neodiprion lecontei TaxID=441921 RepID=A0ABM3GE08_NEOLC|nr:odorant receptor 49b-like [Neodiprion lecontei]